MSTAPAVLLSVLGLALLQLAREAQRGLRGGLDVLSLSQLQRPCLLRLLLPELNGL